MERKSAVGFRVQPYDSEMVPCGHPKVTLLPLGVQVSAPQGWTGQWRTQTKSDTLTAASPYIRS